MEQRKFSFSYIKLILFMITAAFIFIIPFTAQAAVHQEGETFTGGDMYYVDTDSNEYWVVSNNTWHQCATLDSSSSLNYVTSAVRLAMLDRADSVSLYFVTDNENFNPKSSSLSSQELSNTLTNQIVDIIEQGVYTPTDNPASGDYLKMMSSIYNSGSYRLSASDKCEDYSFYYISFKIGNNSSAHQEEQVANFVREWNKLYIDSNPVISASTGDTREYYIVKTAYNFISKNTSYFTDLYKDFNHSKYPFDSVDYINAHTAYGALFGNLVGADKDDFEYVTSAGYEYNMAYTTDAQGLYRVNEKNQGKAVCDGYSLLFYYICHYNGIDCKIITGDNDLTTGRDSDPHAWNMVYLKDYQDKTREWYLVDTTFASQRTQKISDEFTAVSYDFFLRGSSDVSFDKDNHQQAYADYDYLSNTQSEDNYRFNISNIDGSKLNVFVSRRRTADANELYVEDGKYNLENYMIIDPNNNHFKINDSKDSLVAADGFIYYGTGYYYTFELYDFAKGIEYACEDQYLLDAGEYNFEVVTTIGNKVYDKIVNIAPLDMSNWNTYDLNASKINGNDLKDALDANKNLTLNAEFIGATITVTTEIYDSVNKKLEEGKDYIRYIYVQGDKNKKPVNIKDPNTYILCFEYKGNYKGVVEVPFVIEKANIGNYKINVDTTYGNGAANYITTMNLGNANEKTAIIKGVDFEIVSVTGGTNYGETGIINIRGLEGSKYIKAGSTAQWTYKVAKQRDMTSTFDGKVINNEKYCTTGSPIKPDSFTMAYLKDTTTRVDLVKDVDYRITGYSNNVNAGTGIVNVEFIGNYTGKAALKFEIVTSTPAISKTSFTYNGAVQRPSVTIKDASGNQLVYKTDFTVDYDNWSSTDAGTYNMYINYIGRYSGSQIVKYTINPATATVTASNTSFVYNGSVQKPSFTVKDSAGKALNAGTDYTVSYSNASSKELGTYTATVNMSKNYTGSKSFTYTIATCKHSVVTDRAVAATCKNEGKTEGSHCSICGEVIVEQKTIAKLNHNVVTDKATSPTCAVAGKTQGSHCSLCGEVFTAQQTIPALGHKTELRGDVKAKCTADGYTGDQVCTVCGATVVRGKVVPKSATIKKSAVTFNYDGKVHRPSIYVYDRNGTALTYKKDFTVEYSNWSSTDAGTYTVTIRMIGDYDDVRTYSYTINPIASVTPKLNRNTIIYTGTPQRPSVTVKDSKGRTLVYKKDFTVTYSDWNSANVGRYTVTVKMMGGYSGTYTYAYYINPKPTSFLSSAQGGFKALKNGFTLKWNKQTSDGNITGYQIQYSTRSDFKNAATYWVEDSDADTATITGRARNTRYYVRIRAYSKIGNGTFYSDWNSGTKSIVTLK